MDTAAIVSCCHPILARSGARADFEHAYSDGNAIDALSRGDRIELYNQEDVYEVRGPLVSGWQGAQFAALIEAFGGA